jgi:glycosyltransferase involved in cell wall biosynthesis
MPITPAAPGSVDGRAPPAHAPGRPRISVALCTFEGARFLEPQLESLAAQTRLPDELVACDDGSSDGTVEILRAFAGRSPFPVRIEVNAATLRSTKNFEKAIGLCTGDLIATCDQDDVWLPEKLALCEEAFARDPRIGLVFSDAEVVDERLRPLGYRLWDAVHFGRAAQRRVRRGRAFDLLLRQWVMTGATMMFRAEFRSTLLPIPECWIHDGWIAFLIGALAPVGMIPQPTVLYRQHAAQQIGAARLTWGETYALARKVGPEYFRRDHDRFQLARKRLGALAGWGLDPGVLDQVDRKVAHQARRLAISECPSRARRILWTLDELVHGRYGRYSPALSHSAKDMFL